MTNLPIMAKLVNETSDFDQKYPRKNWVSWKIFGQLVAQKNHFANFGYGGCTLQMWSCNYSLSLEM